MKYNRCDDPHYCAENKESDSEGSVVNCSLLCLSMAPFPVRVEDDDADGKREAGDTQEGDLWPDLLLRRPSWECTSCRKRFCGIKDCKGCGEHGEDD